MGATDSWKPSWEKIVLLQGQQDQDCRPVRFPRVPGTPLKVPTWKAPVTKICSQMGLPWGTLTRNHDLVKTLSHAEILGHKNIGPAILDI